MRLLLLLLFLLIKINVGIPVDNSVEGEPEIECGGSSITINFNTRNSFEGHVYVKGLFNEPGCRNDENGRTVAGITLPFDTCNVVRTRSLNPRGIFVSTTVVITFHPHFVTKVDRAYQISCFYMEADKTVSADIAVSDLTTAFQSQLIPMPICRYEVLDSGPTGEPISFAQVGDQVYHKFTCDTETVDTFCMVVHNCNVDDGNGDTVEIINGNGCAIDRFVLNNLEYPSDLMAGQEAHVYKYADRSQLFYQCQITISIKNPGEECSRPQCEEPTGTIPAANVAGVSSDENSSSLTSRTPSTTQKTTSRLRLLRRSKRNTSMEQWKEDAAGTMDVRTELNALDLIDEGKYTSALLSRADGSSLYQSSGNVHIKNLIEKDNSTLCLTRGYVTLSIMSVVIFIFTTTGVSTILLFRSKKII